MTRSKPTDYRSLVATEVPSEVYVMATSLPKPAAQNGDKPTVFKRVADDAATWFRNEEDLTTLDALTALGEAIGPALKEVLAHHGKADALNAYVEAFAEAVEDPWSKALRKNGDECLAAFRAAIDAATPSKGLAASFIAQRAADTDLDTPAEVGTRAAGFIHTGRQGEANPHSLENLLWLMRRWGLHFRYNSISGETLMTMPDGTIVELDDTAGEVLWHDIQIAGLRASIGVIASSLQSRGKKFSFNPLLDAMKQVGPKWDGVPRIDEVFTRYAGVEDTPLHRAWGRSFMLTAVRRMRVPGSPLFFIPVLEALNGGERKSDFVKALTFASPSYFTDTVKLGDDSKQVIENASGKTMIELPELSGMSRKADFEAIKAMATRQSDRARGAYARFVREVPRLFTMIATTNQNEYLPDMGGLRRFAPMKVTGRPDIAALKRDNEQLWAEAIQIEAALASDTNVPESMWPLEAEARKSRIARQGALKIVLPVLEEMPEGAVVRSSDLLALCERLGAPGDIVRNGTTWSDQLSRAGWTRDRRRTPAKAFASTEVATVWIKGKPKTWMKLVENSDEPNFVKAGDDNDLDSGNSYASKVVSMVPSEDNRNLKPGLKGKNAPTTEVIQ